MSTMSGKSKLFKAEALRSRCVLDCIVRGCLIDLLAHVIQGLFRRPDWAEAIRLPLCLVPGGTGNGLSASVGMWTPTQAAHALCKGHVLSMDVVSVLQPPHKAQYSFLSTTYGFIANVDIGTENLRSAPYLQSCRIERLVVEYLLLSIRGFLKHFCPNCQLG